ncbi:MAG TPA: hypothetical protein VFQ85_06550 [Mycobacteriales bacterium]|jgi:hypothetical protein|nr:hypothetical protein [Mycobacteriales bacterium]
MNARVVGAAAVAAGLLAAGGVADAAARPKPVCNQLVDVTGDGNPNAAGFAPVGPSHDPLDIVSGDIASGPRNLVVAIRLKSLTPDLTLSGGVVYRATWQVGKATQDVALYVLDDGSQRAVFRPDTTDTFGTVPVAVATVPSASTILFTIPRRADKALTPKASISGIEMTTAIAFNHGTNTTSTGADRGTTPRKYVDGYPTCLKGV